MKLIACIHSHYFAPSKGAEYCDEHICRCVCLCVCLSAIVSPELCVRSSHILTHVIYGCGTVLLWRRCDTFCTSVYMDDVNVCT